MIDHELTIVSRRPPRKPHGNLDGSTILRAVFAALLAFLIGSTPLAFAANLTVNGLTSRRGRNGQVVGLPTGALNLLVAYTSDLKSYTLSKRRYPDDLGNPRRLAARGILDRDC